jgi:hypothetical protein
MSKVIYKLQLKDFNTYNKVLLPFGSQIISAEFVFHVYEGDLP